MTEAEARERLDAVGPNELPAPPPLGIARRAARELGAPLPVLLLSAAAVSTALGDHVEAAAITVIVVLNTAVAVSQQRRAEAAQRALQRMLSPNARVLRQGKSVVVPAREVVPGDVLELAAGDRVAADGTLCDATALAVDEQMLTGEAFPVDKPPGGTVSGGTLVTRGRALAVVTRTGADSAVGRIAAAVPQVEGSPLGRELRRVAHRMTLVALGLALALIPFMWMRAGRDWQALEDAAMFGVALAVAAIPEGLLAVVTLALAIGGRRLAERGAIVRHLPAIEALGATSLLCVDKTGTLTTGRLRVAEVRAAPGRESDLWAAAARCNDADGGVGDPLDVALLEDAQRRGIVLPPSRRVDEQPFDAGSRFMATVHDTPAGLVVSVKGAPEVVLARCEADPAVGPLSTFAEQAAAQGLKVIAFADAPGADMEARGLRPLGLVAFEDPLRDSARSAVEDLIRAGVRIVLVTGDHPRTAMAIASAVGLTDLTLVTGAQVEAAEDRTALLRSAGVIARVTPEVKRELVVVHQAAGDVVAMTGDGVNDAPALQQADVGVAVAGPTGTDVARQAADIVVTDADLATLAAGVREGRQIGRNLGAATSYLVSGNLSEIAVILAALVLLPAGGPPLLPVHLLWINLVTDGLPALALVSDRSHTTEREGPRAGQRLLPMRALAGLAARGALAAGAVMVGLAMLGDAAAPAATSFIVLALPFAHVLLAFAARSDGRVLPKGWWASKPLMAAVAGTALLQVAVFTVPAGRRLLGLTTLPPRAWGLAVAAALAVLGAIALGRAARRRWTILAVVLLLLATACAERAGERSTPSPSASTSAAPSPSTPPDGTSTAAVAEAWVYFSNERLGDVCTETFGVPRQVRAPAVARGSLEELLKGPTPSERDAGYSSWFSADTATYLRSTRIVGDEARVDFDAALTGAIPGASSSCGSSALLGALDATLMQFDAIRRTRYSLNGDVAAFYEWLQLVPPG